jgi:hypothetical protein
MSEASSPQMITLSPEIRPTLDPNGTPPELIPPSPLKELEITEIVQEEDQMLMDLYLSKD